MNMVLQAYALILWPRCNSHTMLDAAMAGLNLSETDIVPTMSLMGRLGEPREVVQGSLFLSSDAASYVHGTVLHVGSGFELL